MIAGYQIRATTVFAHKRDGPHFVILNWGVGTVGQVSAALIFFSFFIFLTFGRAFSGGQ